MKYYKSYTAKKLKFPRRIIFFLVIAVLAFVFAVILGNNLKKRLNEADINTDPVETVDLDHIEKEHNEKSGNAKHETGKYSAGYLHIDGETQLAAAQAAVSGLKSAGFSAASFIACDEAGLRYASPAMSELSRLPASERVADYDVVRDAVAYAHSIGVRASAVFTKGDSKIDALIISELCQMGFDEIIIRGFEDILSEKGGDITKAVSYLEDIRKVADCDIAVALMPQAYTFARNSYHIEKLFTYTEFLAVDLTGENSESVAALADGFEGSFSAYSLRALVLAEQSDVAEALKTAELSVCQYVTAPAVDPESSENK